MNIENPIQFCPELHPNSSEFSNFYEYIKKIEKQYSGSYGIVKVVPPAGYKARKQDYEKSIANLLLKSPIEQNVQLKKKGMYELLNLQKKSLTLADYKKKAAMFEKYTFGQTLEQVEDKFFRTLSYSPPLYCQDIEGSLMTKGCTWDFNSLQTMLSDGLSSSQLNGVTSPYLYIGYWKTMTPWHKDDMDLGAIYYLHHGSPKFWYGIPQGHGDKFEQFTKFHYAEGFKNCAEYLRHKTTMISPYTLIEQIKNIKINKQIQNPGEFVVVFPGSYYSGFNWGFNIAEGVSYATPMWLELFAKAESCQCDNEHVKIDKQLFYQNLLKNKKVNYKALPEIQKFGKLINSPQNKSLQKKQEISNIVNSSPSKKIKLNGGQTVSTQKQSSNIKQLKQELKQKLNKSINNKKQKNSSQASTKEVILGKRKQSESVEKQSTQALDNWIQCDKCNKWHKLTNDQKGFLKKKSFKCFDLTGKDCEKQLKKQSQQQKFESKLKRGANKQQKASISPERKQIQQPKKGENKVQQNNKQQIKKSVIPKNEVVNWIQCDYCNKWHTLTNQYMGLTLLKKFYCENVTGVSCRQKPTQQLKQNSAKPRQKSTNSSAQPKSKEVTIQVKQKNSVEQKKKSEQKSESEKNTKKTQEKVQSQRSGRKKIQASEQKIKKKSVSSQKKPSVQIQIKPKQQPKIKKVISNKKEKEIEYLEIETSKKPQIIAQEDDYFKPRNSREKRVATSEKSSSAEAKNKQKKQVEKKSNKIQKVKEQQNVQRKSRSKSSEKEKKSKSQEKVAKLSTTTRSPSMRVLQKQKKQQKSQEKQQKEEKSRSRSKSNNKQKVQQKVKPGPQKATNNEKQVKQKVNKKPVEEQPKQIVDWIQCDSCKKWRILPSGQNGLLKQKKFTCNQIKGENCRKKEVQFDANQDTVIKQK